MPTDKVNRGGRPASEATSVRSIMLPERLWKLASDADL